MTNEELKEDLEALKILLTSLGHRVTEKPATDKETVINYGRQVKALELLASCTFVEVNKTPIKDRPMEVMALVGVVNLLTQDIMEKLTKQMEEIRKASPEKQSTSDPVLDGLIEALREVGIKGEVKVLELGHHKPDCNNPNCPIHGNKEPKEEQKN